MRLVPARVRERDGAALPRDDRGAWLATGARDDGVDAAREGGGVSLWRFRTSQRIRFSGRDDGDDGLIR